MQTGIVVNHGGWADGINGNGSWGSPAQLGTSLAVYNTFSHVPASYFYSAIDATAGARFVFRYNRMFNTGIMTHGTGTSGILRSVSTYEIYGNDIRHTANWYAAIYLRGGTGVVWNNTFSGYNASIRLANYRSVTAYPPGDWRRENPLRWQPWRQWMAVPRQNWPGQDGRDPRHSSSHRGRRRMARHPQRAEHGLSDLDAQAHRGRTGCHQRWSSTRRLQAPPLSAPTPRGLG